jgi:hypothetical protein
MACKYRQERVRSSIMDQPDYPRDALPAKVGERWTYKTEKAIDAFRGELMVEDEIASAGIDERHKLKDGGEKLGEVVF